MGFVTTPESLRDKRGHPFQLKPVESIEKPFSGEIITVEPAICFILREKNRKKFENLLTRADGCFIVNIGKGTGDTRRSMRGDVP